MRRGGDDDDKKIVSMSIVRDAHASCSKGAYITCVPTAIMYSVVAFAAPFIYKLFTGGSNRNDDEEQAEYVEGVVCNDSEVGENQMKQVDLEDVGKVLLIRKNGKLSALGAKCTHYGAPLHAGALGENRVRCQWHGACFNVLTGDIEDFPGRYNFL